MRFVDVCGFSGEAAGHDGSVKPLEQTEKTTDFDGRKIGSFFRVSREVCASQSSAIFLEKLPIPQTKKSVVSSEKSRT